MMNRMIMMKKAAPRMEMEEENDLFSAESLAGQIEDQR